MESSRGALRAWLLLAVALLALAVPAARADAAPVPLIVDTDMFSDADDVGALATANALQIRGEAKLIGVSVNTNLDRGAVATDSWRCVAAINAFYGSASVPIGTAMPNTRSTAGDADYATPCAQLAPRSTPAPVSAVTMYRQALAAQPDHSVVIASYGYMGNLADLLSSGPDARQLIADKVKTLVVMGGGYPSFGEETNLAGDPAAAQAVSANWPTKIVWSGYEIGAGLFTGDTISSVHPSNSPVRVAYEAFFGNGPNVAISSWDLTAVYHAVRPGDPSMREVGPGTNAITDVVTEANAFTLDPAGTQYYLQLDDAISLHDSIEALLDTLPPPPPPPPPAATETSTSSPAPHPAAAPAPAATPAPAPAADPVLASRLGSLNIRKPASWVRRHNRFESTLAGGCKVTVTVKPRHVATRQSAARQVRVGTAIAGAAPWFGSGKRKGGAWAVGYRPGQTVRGRAAIRIARNRYVQVVANGMLGAGCSYPDAATLAQPIRTLVRTAAYTARKKPSTSSL